MEKTITNNFLKIKNPQLQENTFFNYDGPISEFDFEKMVPTQFSNYKKIEALLNLQQIYFTSINIVKWKPKCNQDNSSRCKFIIETSNPDFLWYKSESEAYGSGNNQIYYKKLKIKTSLFTSWNQNQLVNLLQQ